MDFALSERLAELRVAMKSLARENPAASSSPGAIAWHDSRLGALTASTEVGGAGFDCLTLAVALEALTWGGMDADQTQRLASHLAIAVAPFLAASQRIDAGASNVLVEGALSCVNESEMSRVDRKLTGPLRALHSSQASWLVMSRMSEANEPTAELTLIAASDPLVVRDVDGARLDQYAGDGVARLVVSEADAHKIVTSARVASAACRLGRYRNAFDDIGAVAGRFLRGQKLKGRGVDGDQSLTHRLADFCVSIEAAELLVFKAACEIDAGTVAPESIAIAELTLDHSVRDAQSAVIRAARDRRLLESDFAKALVATDLVQSEFVPWSWAARPQDDVAVALGI